MKLAILGTGAVGQTLAGASSTAGTMSSSAPATPRETGREGWSGAPQPSRRTPTLPPAPTSSWWPSRARVRSTRWPRPAT